MHASLRLRQMVDRRFAPRRQSSTAIAYLGLWIGVLGRLSDDERGVDRKRPPPYGMHPRGGVRARLAAGESVPSLIFKVQDARTPQREGWNP
jgi:hypothetical protein